MNNIYEENGYKNRKDYLVCLADEYGVFVDTVFALASVLGAVEDFDSLINSLEEL